MLRLKIPLANKAREKSGWENDIKRYIVVDYLK
jgi:hypothetical protein